MKLGRLLRLGKRRKKLSKGEKHSLVGRCARSIDRDRLPRQGARGEPSLLLRVLEEELLAARAEQARPGMNDYKTQLQGCVKALAMVCRYATGEESGPDHEKVFEVD